MIPKIRTPYNWQPKKGEVNDQPSRTVPDQTMSINEIFRRYAQGLPLGGERMVYYDEEDDTPDLDAMELTDRMDYIQELAEKLEAEDKAKAEKKRKAYEDEVIKRYEAQQAEKENILKKPSPPGNEGDKPAA